jgi:hypothetical protein
VLLGLATGRIPLEKYKTEAAVIGHNYTPPNLYGRLVNSGVPA